LSEFGASIKIQRWSRVSVAAALAASLLFVALAGGPVLFAGAMIDKLTILFVYIILAVMWNALAGFGGMFSAGQQAFFGLGAYLSIRLSEWGVEPYVAIALSALIAGALALPTTGVVLRLRAGEFAIGMWVVAECVRLLVNLDPIIQGDTGRSLIALSAFDATARRDFTYWMALGSLALSLGLIFFLLSSRMGASIQAIRDNEEAAASVGVRVAETKRILFVVAAIGCALAGGLWLATFTTFQPRSFFSVQWSAYMIFMVLVGGIGRFEGPIIGAVAFFLIERWLGATGVWYLIALGCVALLFSLFLPKGIWGYVEDRFHISLLPVGYRIVLPGDDSGAKGEAVDPAGKAELA
jgi:branched-chain amino acid transport system permease protein